MTTDRIKVLTAAIRQRLKPVLFAHGFVCDQNARTFRKSVAGCTQIINVQVGVRSLQGQFTINLGVYHPEFRADAYFAPVSSHPMEHQCVVRRRLSSLRETGLTRLFRSWIRSEDSFLKFWLLTPGDKWWPFSADEQQIASSIASVETLLLAKGLDWLAQNSDASGLAAEFNKRKPSPNATHAGGPIA